MNVSYGLCELAKGRPETCSTTTFWQTASSEESRSLFPREMPGRRLRRRRRRGRKPLFGSIRPVCNGWHPHPTTRSRGTDSTGAHRLLHGMYPLPLLECEHATNGSSQRRRLVPEVPWMRRAQPAPVGLLENWATSVMRQSRGVTNLRAPALVYNNWQTVQTNSAPMLPFTLTRWRGAGQAPAWSAWQ